MSEPRRAGERRERALHAPLPAVRARERACFIRVRGGESSDATKPLAFSGGLSDVPGEVGERAPTRPPLNVGRLEPGAYLVVEGTRLSRPALVVCRLTDQDEQLPRARAGSVEEVAVARDRVRPRKAAASLLELAAKLVREERRLDGAPRKDTLLESEDEDRVEAARSRPQEIEDGHASGLPRPAKANRGALERADELIGTDRLAEALPFLQLRDEHADGLVGTEVEAGTIARRGRLETVGMTEHRAGESPRSLEDGRCGPKVVDCGQRMAEELLAFLLDASRVGDRPSAQPALEKVDAVAWKARIRRAQEGEEVASLSAVREEAQEPEQRVAERRAAERHRPLERVRDAEGAEDSLERGAPPLDVGGYDCDPLGRFSCPKEREDLVGDELERAARACTLEEANRSLDGRPCFMALGEERPLEVGERLRAVPALRRELLDPAVGEPREVSGRPLERGEDGPAGLVRQRDGDVSATGERLEQRPLRSCQVLEAVREDGRAVPGREVAGDELGGVAAPELP